MTTFQQLPHISRPEERCSYHPWLRNFFWNPYYGVA